MDEQRHLFRRAHTSQIPGSVTVLSHAQPGSEVTISSIAGLGKAEEKSLQAYGILPGRKVKVLSQAPVTIVQVEQTELAFEIEVASRIMIEPEA